jgi:hypothetical protein
LDRRVNRLRQRLEGLQYLIDALAEIQYGVFQLMYAVVNVGLLG